MSFVEHRSIAVTFTPTETRRDVIVEVAEAERLGYAAFFVAEGWAHDAVVLLAEIAARTERITLSAGVLNVWSRSAGLLAMAAVSLQEASEGALRAGAGRQQPATGGGAWPRGTPRAPRCRCSPSPREAAPRTTSRHCGRCARARPARRPLIVHHGFVTFERE